jgi:hypothetical protein
LVHRSKMNKTGPPEIEGTHSLLRPYLITYASTSISAHLSVTLRLSTSHS